MSHKPSAALRKAFNGTVGDHEYAGHLEKDFKVANAIKEVAQTHFGAAVYAALENIERGAYSTLAKTSPWRKDKIRQAQCELRTAQYIKAYVESFVDNADVFAQQLSEIYGND